MSCSMRSAFSRFDDLPGVLTLIEVLSSSWLDMLGGARTRLSFDVAGILRNGTFLKEDHEV